MEVPSSWDALRKQVIFCSLNLCLVTEKVWEIGMRFPSYGDR
jgi:hypothetical protein